MKRDMDLVRSILTIVGESDSEVDIADLVTDQWKFKIVLYHVELMSAFDLIDTMLFRDSRGKIVRGNILGLTWNGQDMLDAMGNDAVWQKAKKVISDTVGTTTFEVIKSTCVKVATGLITAALP